MKYICPMHPEVIQEKPGRCSKCGMALVLESEASSHTHHHAPRASWKDYLPLIVVVSMITLAAVLVSESSLEEFLMAFMTGFFLVFGGFKLLDLKGFVEGYSTYDLLARQVPAYGYVYPFIELFFGFSMLAGFMPEWLLWAEFAVMLFGGIGVAIKLAKKEKFQCACLGTVLKVPLTKITLIEDFGMAALALLLLYLF